MLSKVKSFGLNGILGYEVSIEIDVYKSQKAQQFETVGLPDAAVKESKERVKSAIINSGLNFTFEHITINLAPADTKKEGSYYDLPIALGVLSNTHNLNRRVFEDIAFIGELSLDGSLRRVNGILPILIFARDHGYKRVVVPYDNSSEAAIVDGIETFALKSLSETMFFLENPSRFSPVAVKDIMTVVSNRRYNEDFKYIKGQQYAKRAMEIAAAGGHNILLLGPPGGGKTMLAKSLPSILPDMTPIEVLETTKIHSVAGKLDYDEGVVCIRPFRTPHHTSSTVALTGGGSSARPGEISLAHNGVLFLDEILEYPRSVLEVLRQPLEDKQITVSRAMRSVKYPANFMLVASMNPCPCGYYGSKDGKCNCTPAQITKYLSKLSGPLLDRIDLHIEVDGITYNELASEDLSEDSQAIRKRVNEARQIQNVRYKSFNKSISNSMMTSEMTNMFCKLDERSATFLKRAFEKLGLSARAYSRILKVARTIADLSGSENIQFEHLTEAIGYRSLDRNYWK